MGGGSCPPNWGSLGQQSCLEKGADGKAQRLESSCLRPKGTVAGGRERSRTAPSAGATGRRVSVTGSGNPGRQQSQQGPGAPGCGSRQASPGSELRTTGCLTAQAGGAQALPLPKTTARGGQSGPRETRRPPNAPGATPSPKPSPSPKARDPREGQQAEGKSPKAAGPGGSPQNRGRFEWKGATGDGREAAAGTGREAAEGCPGEGWAARRGSRTRGSYLQRVPRGQPPASPFGHRAQPSASAGRLLRCPPRSHLFKNLTAERKWQGGVAGGGTSFSLCHATAASSRFSLPPLTRSPPRPLPSRRHRAKKHESRAAAAGRGRGSGMSSSAAQPRKPRVRPKHPHPLGCN